MKIALASFTNRGFKSACHHSMVTMAMYTSMNAKRLGITNIASMVPRGISGIEQARQDALDSAIAKGINYLWLSDDDMIFSANTLEVMLSRSVPFIGINYIFKTDDETLQVAVGLNGKRISSIGKSGIEEVESIGFGGILINIDAIKHIAAPHFERLWDDKTKSYVGEDIYCCRKLRAAGIKLHVDHAASQNVGHVGDKIYKE